MKLPSVDQISADLCHQSKFLTQGNIRSLVDQYYQIQEYRKSSANQILSLKRRGQFSEINQFILDNLKTVEMNLKKLLDAYTNHDPTGLWCKSIKGIGPVITAGLLSYIDIEKAPTVGHIWRYAGLDPTVKWEKGKKRPWNARLKKICWNIGESFVKVSNRGSFYGELYKQRKLYEQAKNERGDYQEQAVEILARNRYGGHTEAIKWYTEGKLPPLHIHERAKRYAVKIFLSHFHEVAYIEHYGEKPPKPYPIAILNHAHQIEPPKPI